MWTVFLSRRYFLSKRKEGMISLIGGISVLGVALGVAALIIVMSIMNGFDREIKKKIIGTYAHVVILKDGVINDPAEVIARAAETPGVVSAAEFISGQAVLRKDKMVTGILIKGVDPDKESEVSQIVEFSGGNGKSLKDNTIILGRELMNNEGVAPGDTVELMVAYSAMDLQKIKLEVAGSFTSGRYDYDSNIGIVGIETAAELFRMDGAVSGIGLRVIDEMEPEDVKIHLQAMLGYPYIVKTWQDFDRNLVTALALEKKMMFIILALIVMVACFNISSSLIMMVMEKTRDIGILKAIGANSMGIRSVFFLEGLIIGGLGVLMGGGAGIFISRRVNEIVAFIEKTADIKVFPSDVYYFTEIPVLVSMKDVSGIVSVALILTLLSGIYPAWKASRMDPVKAIRYE
ncbi:MAG: FtsX-like permease family protein [Candidatus Omnitrophota bacterium]